MKQTDPSDSSPVGVTNTHLDSKGYYFANGVNIIPGQNMPLDSITKEQAQDILRSEVINYINSEDLIELQKIANQEISNVPVSTRIGQVLTSKVVNGKLVAAWDDLANVPQYSTDFKVDDGSDGGDNGTDTTGLFTSLTNATYTAIDKYDQNNHLQPKDASKPYGADISLDEDGFVFQFNSQNESVAFETSTGVDIVFKNNFDGTITVTDGSQEPVVLDYKEDGTVHLGNGGNIFDVSIVYSDSENWTDIQPSGIELAGGRKFTSMIVNGSAATIFYVQSNLSK